MKLADVYATIDEAEKAFDDNNEIENRPNGKFKRLRRNGRTINSD